MRFGVCSPCASIPAVPMSRWLPQKQPSICRGQFGKYDDADFIKRLGLRRRAKDQGCLAQPGEYPARRHTDMQPERRTKRATTAPSIVAAGTVRGRERVVCIAQGWKQSRAINNSLRSPGSLEYLLPRPSVEEIIIMLLKGLRGECRHGIKGPASQAAGARYVRPLRPCP